MSDEERGPRRGDTEAEAKRSGRDGADPESQPGEYVDEMRVNRFTPPPDPPTKNG